MRFEFFINLLLPLALILAVPWYNLGRGFISWDPFEFDIVHLLFLTIAYAIFFGIIWLWRYLTRRYIDNRSTFDIVKGENND